MNTQQDARLELIDQLPEKVCVAFRSDDDGEIARALDAQTDEEQEKTRAVLRELAALPDRFPLTPDEQPRPTEDDSPDEELCVTDGLPQVPEMLFRVVGGAPLKPPLEWQEATHRAERLLPIGSALFPVWYATNRRLVEEGRFGEGFTGERDPDGRVHHGVARVFVPAVREPGSLGTFWLKRWLWTWQDDRVVLRRIQGRTEPEFWVELRGQLAELKAAEEGAPNSREHVLLFVHGFNVSFAAAMVRAAQLGFDLGFPLTACFSWPSFGRFWKYTGDEAACEPSVPALAAFIAELVNLAGPGRVHILTHSMGNRVVLRAVEQLAWQARTDRVAAQRKLGNLLLAAPDIDRDLFRLLAPSCLKVSALQTQLYVSHKDNAVALSRWLHSYHRAGFHPPLTILPGVSTIDVTHGDISGHSFYGDERRVLLDMSQVLHYDTRPGAPGRPLLPGGAGRYWSLV
jgi:pimeloyl-ACP methyl ester carboxylesterase